MRQHELSPAPAVEQSDNMGGLGSIDSIGTISEDTHGEQPPDTIYTMNTDRTHRVINPYSVKEVYSQCHQNTSHRSDNYRRPGRHPGPLEAR